MTLSGLTHLLLINMPIPVNLKAHIPTILVVFGATGDLMTKKIVPSLFHLFEAGRLPKHFKLIGFSHRQLDQAGFKKHVLEILKHHKDSATQRKNFSRFVKLVEYQPGDFEKFSSYRDLAKTVDKADDGWGICTNKLFYLAVPPKYYRQIFTNLEKSGLTKPCSPAEGWSRVLVEKPFGDDFKTAQELAKFLASLFKEEQIFIIDHYLGKEMVQNILAARFSNNLFEHIFNSEYIQSISLTLLEKKGVEQRGPFYDAVGALRDVGQNHLLQLLALLTMNAPLSLDAKYIRERRAEILKYLKPLTQSEIKRHTFRAQYQNFDQISGVKKGSQTETYFKVRGFLTHPRWKGVPFTMEAGKRLKTVDKKVILTIRHTTPCLCPGSSEHYQNKIIFSIEPTEGIAIEFWSKKPGLEWQIERRELDFTFREKSITSQYTEEYEKLLFDCIVGDQTLFVSTQEIQSMWKFIDPIISAWQKNAVPLHQYQPNTDKVRDKAKLLINGEAVAAGQQMTPQLGLVGLGKMGVGLALNLHDKGWQVHVYNRSPEKTRQLEKEGLVAAYSLEELIRQLPSPKVVWLMVSAGQPVDETIFGKNGLVSFLKKGDYIIDGGNSFYEDTIKRAKKLASLGINYIDCGVSGGPEGARHGACLMVGGRTKDQKYLSQLFIDLAVHQGVSFFDGYGAGHFVKMVHNGIEYGMMQAMAEGFDILKNSKYKLHLSKVAQLYNHGSVIESRLVGWLKEAFDLFGDDLKKVSGQAKESGEGRWTVAVAKKRGIAAKVIKDSLEARKRSQKRPNYQGKVIQALRHQFGGHNLK